MFLPILLGMPGFSEMIIIVIVMLLIFGPKLPEVARSIGKILGEIQHGFYNFRDELMHPDTTQHKKSDVSVDTKKTSGVDTPVIHSPNLKNNPDNADNAEEPESPDTQDDDFADSDS